MKVYRLQVSLEGDRLKLFYPIYIKIPRLGICSNGELSIDDRMIHLNWTDFFFIMSKTIYLSVLFCRELKEFYNCGRIATAYFAASVFFVSLWQNKESL